MRVFKFFAIIFYILLLASIGAGAGLFVANIGAAEEAVETVTFGWDQEDLTNLTQWELMWSDTAGGPYDQVAIISYDPGASGPGFTAPVEATVTGEQATHVVKYFVLRACGDIPQADGSTLYECSDYSNEVSYDFWIPAGRFSIPVNFLIVPTEE